MGITCGDNIWGKPMRTAYGILERGWVESAQYHGAGQQTFPHLRGWDTEPDRVPHPPGGPHPSVGRHRPFKAAPSPRPARTCRTGRPRPAPPRGPTPLSHAPFLWPRPLRPVPVPRGSAPPHGPGAAPPPLPAGARFGPYGAERNTSSALSPPVSAWLHAGRGPGRPPSASSSSSSSPVRRNRDRYRHRESGGRGRVGHAWERRRRVGEGHARVRTCEGRLCTCSAAHLCAWVRPAWLCAWVPTAARVPPRVSRWVGGTAREGRGDAWLRLCPWVCVSVSVGGHSCPNAAWRWGGRGGSTARSGRGDTAGCGISCVRGSVSVGPHGRACPPREESPNVGCGAPWERMAPSGRCGAWGEEGDARGCGGLERPDWGCGAEVGWGMDRRRGNGAVPAGGGHERMWGRHPDYPPLCAPRATAERAATIWFLGGYVHPFDPPPPRSHPSDTRGVPQPTVPHSRVTAPRGPHGDPPRALLLLLLLHSRRR